MFSHHEIVHFRTFGYVVLRGLLGDAEVMQLRDEVTSSLTDAFGRVGAHSHPDGGGIRGDYLPLAAQRTPLSRALIADDPRLFQGSAALIGGPTVPTIPIATCFTSNSGWHDDDGTDLGGVKFLVHLDPRRADSGALRVIAGTQQASFRRAIKEYFREDPGRQGFAGWPVPYSTLETDPGDVIAFDVHLVHSSSGGGNRLAWTIDYLPWPGVGDPARLAGVRASVLDLADFGHMDYDRERWPTWHEWMEAPRPPSRQTAIERLRLLGVLGDDDAR